MAVIELPFGEWLPDREDRNNPGLVTAKNVIATPAGYAPFRSYLDFSGGHLLTANTAWSSFGFVRFEANGTIDFAHGGDSVLYIGTNATAVPTQNLQPWAFARYGDKVFAIREGAQSTDSELYQHDVGTTTWANVAINGLKGRHIARIENFLVIGGASLGVGDFAADPTGLRWSAINNPLDFTPSQTTQSGAASVDYPELGDITALVGGRIPIMFQRRGVTRLQYVGPPRGFADTEISREDGCIAPGSVVQLGDITYFFSHNGVCATDGVSVQRIGSGRVDRWLSQYIFAGVNPDVKSAVLWDRKQIIWSLRSGVFQPPSASVFDVHLLYSWETNSFSMLDGDFVTGGVINVPSVTVAGAPNAYALGVGVDLTMRPEALNADTLAAEMTTGHMQVVPGQRVSVTGLEPLYVKSPAEVGSVATAAVSTKNVVYESPTVTAYAPQNAIGVCDVRANGRYAAASVRLPAGRDWGQFAGVLADVESAGDR